MNPKVLSGTVSDGNQTPITYAHLGIIGVPNGTITDESGRFRFNISQMSPEDTLFVSAIGYKTRKYGFNELSAERKMNIILEEKIYTGHEIQVTAQKENPIHFGRNKSDGNSGWVYSGIATGNEVGMIFNNDEPVTFNALNFHVNTSDFDSLLYRIHFYDIQQNQLKPLNKKDILLSASTSQDLISADLTGYELTSKQDFSVTIEVLKGWKDGALTTRGSIKFTGRNSLSKQMIQRSHQFIQAEKENIKLNISVTAYPY